MWSPTALTRYRACPRQWHLIANGDREEQAGGDETRPMAMRRGIVMHAGIEAAYRAVVGNLEPSWSESSYMDAYQERARDGLRAEADRVKLVEDEDFDLGELYALEDELCALLSALPRPTAGKVLAVEEELTGETPFGHPIRARVDLILRTGKNSLHIRDWKRSRTLPRPDELRTNDQLAVCRHLALTRWPWATRVTVGLYSTRDRREVIADVPAPIWDEHMEAIGHLADIAESDTAVKPKPGAHCAACPVSQQCPTMRRE